MTLPIPDPPGERRWRRWAVLIGEHGLIDDCLHEALDARGFLGQIGRAHV